MSDVDPFTASLDLVRSAVATLPSEIERALCVQLPRLDARTVVATGIGASEGPARLLVHRLASSGIPARFASISEVARDEAVADLLVVFSQGLSPNARLALPSAHRFGARILVTSVSPDDATDSRRAVLESLVARGVEPIVVPPAVEKGTLIRFVGPTVASVVALRLAGALGDAACANNALSRAGHAYAAGARDAAQPLPPEDEYAFAIVGSGVTSDELFAARWKLLEAMLVSDPPTWDILSFSHGPVQSMRDRKLALVVLETTPGKALADRLAESIDAEQHRVVRLRASTDGPLRAIEHAARLDAALLATFEARPRNLFTWPGCGNECALYALGDDSQ